MKASDRPWKDVDLDYDDAAQGIASVIWFMIETNRGDIAADIEREFGVLM